MEGMPVSDTIMVVEDDDATREFLADHLAADSYGVVTAATGRQALNLLEVKDCDLVLLDVMLPDASGFELCRRLRDSRWDRAADRPGGAGDHAQRAGDGDRPGARIRTRCGRLHRQAVQLSGGRGTDRCRAEACSGSA